jgi:hypothetical protein
VQESNRRDPRVKATLAVNMDGRIAGVTKDVSASGVFFETDEDMADGSPIEFTVEFDGPTGKFVLRCTGQVVRVERSGGKLGVAAKILDSKLEMRVEPMGNNPGAPVEEDFTQAVAVSR